MSSYIFVTRADGSEAGWRLTFDGQLGGGAVEIARSVCEFLDAKTISVQDLIEAVKTPRWTNRRDWCGDHSIKSSEIGPDEIDPDKL